MSGDAAVAPSRVAIVTGGSRGIGRAVVERLARAGLDVRFTFLKGAQAASALVEQLRVEGHRAQSVQVDARDASASGLMVQRTIAECGRLDILVNNAGVVADRLLPLMDHHEWSLVLETSLNGLFGASQPAARQMMRQRAGRIVNLTSVSGLVGVLGQTNYSTAKAGIIGFTRSLAKELAASGVPVNAVAPGFVETDMLASLSADQREGAMTRVPMRRFAAADEVAALVAYLALDCPTYLTGQTIVIDGGLSG
jgi:3-oxoacyl-[acyl-carrier protein] reductase